MADATPATNATNHTRYFNLPLFISTDRPSWLVDWNGAMGEIDTILNDIATTSEGASSAVSTIQTQIDTLSATVTSLNSIVDTAVADVASMQTTVDAVDTRLDSVEADLITQNNLIKTLSDTVVAMQATVSSLDNHVTTLNDAVTTMGVNVSAVQTALNGVTSDVSALQSSVASINSSLSSLDSRVTALENGGTGGVPIISDLNWTTESKSWSDITSTRVTLAKPSVDSYVFVEMEIGSLGGLTTSADVGQFTINGGITLLKMAVKNSTSGFREATVSGVVKVAANQEIYLLSPNWTTGTVSEGMTIFNITVHMANA